MSLTAYLDKIDARRQRATPEPRRCASCGEPGEFDLLAVVHPLAHCEALRRHFGGDCCLTPMTGVPVQPDLPGTRRDGAWMGAAAGIGRAAVTHGRGRTMTPFASVCLFLGLPRWRTRRALPPRGGTPPAAVLPGSRGLPHRTWA
jgi:hypothetical protein